jgi:hypothetical protein
MPGTDSTSAVVRGQSAQIGGLLLAKGIEAKGAPTRLAVERLFRSGHEASRPQCDHFVPDDSPICVRDRQQMGTARGLKTRK